MVRRVLRHNLPGVDSLSLPHVKLIEGEPTAVQREVQLVRFGQHFDRALRPPRKPNVVAAP